MMAEDIPTEFLLHIISSLRLAAVNEADSTM
jgi:hypothetical protein